MPTLFYVTVICTLLSFGIGKFTNVSDAFTAHEKKLKEAQAYLDNQNGDAVCVAKK